MMILSISTIWFFRGRTFYFANTEEKKKFLIRDFISAFLRRLSA